MRDTALDQVDLLEKNLERQVTWITASDAKIALLIPTNTLMTGFLIAQIARAELGPLRIVMVTLTIALLASSYLNAGLAVVPRFRNSGPSSLYFGGIASQSLEQFRTRITGMTNDDYVAELIALCHSSATIARATYRHVRNAYNSFFASLLFWATSVYTMSGSL